LAELERVTDASFAEQVEASAVPFLVEFTSPMCAPCLALEPVLRELVDDYGGRLRVGQLDVARDTDTPERFGVRSAPTMLLFTGGEPVRRLMGAKNKRNLLEALSDHLLL
jgi:thioredoxin 1